MEKTLKQTLEVEYRKIWGNNEHMVDYCVSKISEVVKLKDGWLVFDKPDIEKHFCFGYGCCGISSDEEEVRAYDSVKNAATNKNYFFKENLEPFDQQIENVKSGKYYIGIGQHYYREYGASILAYNLLSFWDVSQHPKDYEKYREATDEEKALIIKTLESEKAKFEKRLNTYFKRYGLSKIKTWAYLRD